MALSKEGELVGPVCPDVARVLRIAASGHRGGLGGGARDKAGYRKHAAKPQPPAAPEPKCKDQKKKRRRRPKAPGAAAAAANDP